MTSGKTGLMITVMILGVVSCEKVIDIPLVEADRKLVVECELYDSLGFNYLLLTKTGSVYEENNFDHVSGAVASVTTGGGEVYPLSESVITPGYYSNDTLQVIPGETYNLSVSAEGETITSSGTAFESPVINAVYQQKLYNVFGAFSGSDEDSIIIVVYDFHDDPDEVNYYLRRAWLNSDPESQYSVFDDDLWNGQTVSGGMWEFEVHPGDTVHFDLICIDYANYRYFLTLQDNSTSETAPANPESNLDGNALGYFGVYSLDRKSYIVAE